MSSSSIFAPTDPIKPAGQNVWPTLAATAFVLLCLLALAFIPMWASTRIQSLRTEIEVVAQPTHPLATRLQYMVARQAASIRSFALVGDSVSLQRYREARAQEQEIAYQLQPLTERLNPALQPAFRRIRVNTDAWHALSDSLAAGSITRQHYVALMNGQLVRYRTVIDSLEGFNAALVQETERRQQEIRAIERSHYRTTILLALSGLVAAFVVGWLSRRERLFALHNAELLRSSWQAEQRWRLLADAGTIVGATLDYAASLRDLARLMVRRVATWCTIDLFPNPSDVTRLAAVHADPDMESLLHELSDPSAAVAPDTPEMVRSGKPVLLPDGITMPPSGDGDSERAVLTQVGAASLVAAPMVARGTTIGAITLGSGEHERHYAEQDLHLILELAHRTALQIDNAQLYENAVIASNAKSDFLAVMSHELRTPLTAVIGYADLLELQVSGPLTGLQTQQLQRIKLSARHLLDIIDEILSFTRLEAKRESLNVQSVNVADLVNDAAAIIRPMADSKEITFTATSPAAEIRTDSAKVRRVLLNLLTNAVSFTQRGAIKLEAATSHTGVIFRISDTGIGIEPEHLDRIFDPFWQVAPATTRDVGGMGLGLSVARQIASLLGGTIEVSSAAGEGSTFTFHLPTEIHASAHGPGAGTDN